MKGIYYKSANDNQSHFLITYTIKQIEHNVEIAIYDIELPQQNYNNGDIIESMDDKNSILP